MEKPLISVIVPVYKVEQYLDKCIDSITAQTYDNLEIILVDDGSPDNCPQMCDARAERDSRIKVIHKQNGGLSSARNAGLKVMKGEYVCFVDSDDFIEPDMLEKLYSAASKEGADISVCNFSFVNGNGDVSERTEYAERTYRGDEVFKAYLSVTPFGASVCNKLYGSILIKENNISFDEGIRWGEDHRFNYFAFKNAGCAVTVSDALYNYLSAREGSISTPVTADSVNRWTLTEYELNDEELDAQERTIVLRVLCGEILCCIRELLRSGNEELTEENYTALTDKVTEYSQAFLELDGISAASRLSIRLIRLSPSLFKLLYSGYNRIKGQ